MRTVYWETNSVKLIDQRKLPWEYKIESYSDYRDLAQAIADMVVRGAPAIGATAGFGMALAARQFASPTVVALQQELQRAADVLLSSRPTAVNLKWAVTQQLELALSPAWSDVTSLQQALLVNAQRIADEDVSINQRMGAHGATLVNDGDTIIHHCNTGSLATVDYGTALGVIRAAHEQGKKIHVLVDETRPRLQGARLTAWELDRIGVSYDLIADNAAGHFMRTGQVNLVLVGADRIAANGDVANKIGTYKLAVVAKENNIPFYSVAPTSTIDLELKSGDDIPIEERPSIEVTHVFGKQIAPNGASARNPAFDVTPNKYVSGIVTEFGVMHAPFITSLAYAVSLNQAA